MSHVCGRTSSAKNKASKILYRKMKQASKDALPTGRAGSDCKCSKCSKSEQQHKTKKLLSRKERNQIRDGGKEAKSIHHYYNHQTSKDVSYDHKCCHSILDAHPNIAPVTHEPSVITDSRLIGHHGVFNHEVKSIDIERLLSEQRKLDRSEKLVREKRTSTFANPPANNTEYLLDSTYDKALISNKKAVQSPVNFSKKREKKTVAPNSQGSDLTPGQRPRKTPSSSMETNKNDNSSDVVISGIKEAQPAVCENNSDSHQTPCSFNENKSNLPGSLPSLIERTPKKTESAANLCQATHSTPLLPCSPHMAGASSSLTQQENLDADSVAMSVKAIAASLCNAISFSMLRGGKKLVSESREVLVKALWQRHGAQFKSNILKVQQRLYSYEDDDQGEEVELSHSPIFSDRNESPFFRGEFPIASETRGFDTSSFAKTAKPHFDWNSTDWFNPLDQTIEWFGIPAENLPDDTFSRRGSPQFSEGFEFQNSMSSEKREPLFSPSFAPSCLDGPTSSGQTGDFFISTREFAMPETTNHYMTFSDLGTVRHRRSPLNNNDDPLHSASFPQMHSLFERHQYSYGKSFSDEIPYFHHENTLEPSRHVSFPSAFRPVDLANYPPSHIVERGPILSTSSSFPSPEHWSFPPMRLY